MRLAELNWPAVAALSKDTPVVAPIAALEQHGGHLPLFTDSMLLAEVVRRAEPALGDRVLWAPLFWLGNSHHHLDFAGTLSAAPRTYLDLLGDLIDNLVKHGFRRIVLLNGHGGNITPARQAVFEARQRYREPNGPLFLEATYWQLASGPRVLPPSFTQDQMGHACEWETSMILRLEPRLVGPIEGLEPVPLAAGFEPGARGWLTQDRSTTGHIGDPRSATAAKGQILLEMFATEAAAYLERVISWDGCSRLG